MASIVLQSGNGLCCLLVQQLTALPQLRTKVVVTFLLRSSRPIRPLHSTLSSATRSPLPVRPPAPSPERCVLQEQTMQHVMCIDYIASVDGLA